MRPVQGILAAACIGIVAGIGSAWAQTQLQPQSQPPSSPPRVLQVPEFPREFVGLPEFDTATRKQVGATAFVAKLDSGPDHWLFSVRHRLDDLDPAQVRDIFFKPFVGGAPFSLNVSFLPIPAAQAAPSTPLADLLIFRLVSFPPHESLHFAAADPAVGDNVWIIGRMKSDTPDMPPIHPARISAVPQTKGDPSQWLVADFYDPTIESWGSGGAPVLNAAGEIVGVHSIHRTIDGKTQALIIPVSLIRSLLNSPAAP